MYAQVHGWEPPLFFACECLRYIYAGVRTDRADTAAIGKSRMGNPLTFPKEFNAEIPPGIRREGFPAIGADMKTFIDKSPMSNTLLGYLLHYRQEQPSQETAPANNWKNLEDLQEKMFATYLQSNSLSGRIQLKDFLGGLEKNLLLYSLKLTGGNQRKAASILGIKPTTLFEKLRKYQIQEKDISLNDKDWQRYFYSSL
jgi:DNA-binding protein Fis